MQSATFENIRDFVQIKQHCIFCKTPLRSILTNFEGFGKNGIPLLNAPIGHDKIDFNVSKTTATYSIQADGAIDIRTNALVFDVTAPYNIPYLAPGGDVREAEPTACDVFLDMKPYVQIYCPSKSCNMDYAISSGVFTLQRVHHKSKNFSWMIKEFNLWMETFTSGSLWVQNDWMHNSTNIYSRNNPDADAISVPLIDFESMNKDKLITRIKTLVTFS